MWHYTTVRSGRLSRSRRFIPFDIACKNDGRPEPYNRTDVTERNLRLFTAHGSMRYFSRSVVRKRGRTNEKHRQYWLLHGSYVRHVFFIYIGTDTVWQIKSLSAYRDNFMNICEDSQ